MHDNGQLPYTSSKSEFYVQITMKEIYDLLLAVSSKLDRIEEQQREIIKDATDHESRIRSLEKSRWPLPSVALAISTLVAVLSLLGYLNGGS